MAMAQSLVLSILVLVLAFCILQVQGIKELPVGVGGGGQGRGRAREAWVGVYKQPLTPCEPHPQAVMEGHRTVASGTAERRFPPTLSAATGSRTQP